MKTYDYDYANAVTKVTLFGPAKNNVFQFLAEAPYKDRLLVVASFFVYFGRISSLSERSSGNDYFPGRGITAVACCKRTAKKCC